MEYVHHRIYAYIFTIIMHTGNLIYLAIFIQPHMKINQDLIILKNLQPRFFTIWTLMIQMFYAFVCLVIDVRELKNRENKKYKLSKYFRGFRDTLFASVLWPACWVVTIVFWSLSLYDKALVFPKNTDKLLNPISNHIMHTAIIPLAVWEIMYRYRTQPRTHRKYFYHMVFFFALYFVVITYTYFERGIWIYPIFAKFYGTIYFPLIHTVISGIAIFAYFLQWPLTDYFWRERRNVKKVT
ncbi:androgen-dependent TFPI-regulating protein-like [Colias croceus]|uniref:androgen-dependent TFPI-regulating protein-like n=1 Tax=Colias crocea TaxID=72248 RepID=UPI001E27F261|nr:androgen-dependent TFPI-regulating protein-like [Colias croceus]